MENIKCAHDKMVDINSLVANPRNPNKHPSKQIEMLAKIIKHQGQRSPVVVSNRSGFIVKGHGRLEAMLALEWTQIAVDYQDYDSEAQEFQDMVADNKIAELAEHDDSFMIEGIHDLELDDSDFQLLGMDDFELPFDEDKEEIEDDVPTDVDTRCKPGDLWILGEHRLLCGDSTNIQNVERLMGGEKADMVFTDPPYGIKYKGKGQDGATKGNDFGQIKNDESVQVAKDAFNLAQQLCDNLIFWGANFYPSVLREQKSWIVWNKKTIGENYSDCELAYTSKAGRIKMFEHQWHGMIKASESGQKRVHPTQKPIALAEWCFEKQGDPKSVLDLFGGSGSTLIACEKTNRKCFMMELDAHYCDVILKRWEDYSGKTAILNVS